MQAEEAGQVIRLLCAAYPTYPVGDDTSSLYVEALMSRDADAALAAARHWITTQAQFPRISELLAAVRGATRHQPAAPLELVRRPTPDQIESAARVVNQARRRLRPELGDHHDNGDTADIRRGAGAAS